MSNEADSLRAPLLLQLEESKKITDTSVLITENDEETATSTTVTTDDDDDDHDDDSNSSSSSFCRHFLHRVYTILHTPLILDREVVRLGEQVILEDSVSVKLCKFVAFTFGSIALVHALVVDRPLHLTDRDHELTWHRMWTYDGNLVLLDTVVFFLIGRLWKQNRPGVDHLAFVLPVVLCNAYFEGQQDVAFLRHSLTRYEMRCTWPRSLWLFVVVCVGPTVLGLVGAHAHRAWRQKTMLAKSLEVAGAALFFVQPVWSSPYLHVHHWFAGWMLGMHCNYDDWWSRAAMAWCWGMYINGIAVYGRTPVLGCEYTEFLLEDHGCSANGNNNMWSLLETAENTLSDWRNCAVD